MSATLFLSHKRSLRGEGEEGKEKILLPEPLSRWINLYSSSVIFLELLPILKTLSKCKLAKYTQRARLRGYATRGEHLKLGTQPRIACLPSLARPVNFANSLTFFFFAKNTRIVGYCYCVRGLLGLNLKIDLYGKWLPPSLSVGYKGFSA